MSWWIPMTKNNTERKQENGWKGDTRGDILQQHHKRVKDQAGFGEMFRMDVTDSEFILVQISDLISPQERLGGTNPIKWEICNPNEELALTLRYLATGESFQSLSFQYRILFNVVSYIVKSCCKVIVEWMASAFVKTHQRNLHGSTFRKSLEKDRIFHTL